MLERARFFFSAFSVLFLAIFPLDSGGGVWLSPVARARLMSRSIWGFGGSFWHRRRRRSWALTLPPSLLEDMVLVGLGFY